MIIIGINSAYHEQSVAIIVDGQLVAAAEEERFNRVRHGKRAYVNNADDLPWQALRYCLTAARVKPSEVDHIGYSFDPWKRRQHCWKDSVVGLPVAGDFGTPEGEEAFFQSNLHARQVLKELMRRAAFHFIPHHLCHAASAFLVSPFQEAGILVVDGIAESTSAWLGVGAGQNIENLGEIEDPHSLGFLWEKVSGFSGFDPYQGPGKLMALGSTTGPRGKSTGRDYRALFREFVRTTDDGGFTIDPSVLGYRESGFRGLESLFGPQDGIVADVGEIAAMAAGLQIVTDEIMIHLTQHLYQRINSRRGGLLTDLCLAGGVALNCVTNTRLMESTGWRRLWVQPAANDAGTALGAALVIWNLALGRRERVVFHDAFLGPEFSDAEYEQTLRRSGQTFTRPPDLAKRVAELLAMGQFAAWFQGRMEFGPRALGNRSILADPTRSETRMRMNQKIKEREVFRPFAPSVLATSISSYFEVPFSCQTSDTSPLDFMLAAVSVREDLPTQISAVIQENESTGRASSRVHLVSQRSNPLFHELITTFEKLTGQALVLNTSFNISEPLVCLPEHAIATFLRSDLDVLALGPYLVERNL